MVADHPLRVGVRVRPLERDALEHADGRGQPVCGRAGREHVLDHGACPPHLLARGRVEAHCLAIAGDAHGSSSVSVRPVIRMLIARQAYGSARVQCGCNEAATLGHLVAMPRLREHG